MKRTVIFKHRPVMLSPRLLYRVPMNLLSIAFNTRPMALPTALQVEPCNWCNLRCRMCPYSYQRRDKRALDYSLYERVIKEVKPTYLLLTGATESFLHKDIFKMIDFGAKYATVKIDTNATLLTSDLVDRILDSRLSILSISLDSADKERYEKLREGASFDSVARNIELLARRRDATGSSLHIHINAVMLKTNIDDITGILRFAGSVRVEHVGVAMMGGYGIDDPEYQSLLLSREDIPALASSLEEAGRVASELGIHFDSTQIDDFIKKEGDYRSLAMSLPCYMPSYYAYIDSGGDVFPCCYSQEEGLVFGNVKEQSFKSIWYSQRFAEFRKRLRNCKFGYCQNCIVGDMDIFNALERIPFVKLPRASG
jgi:radical SAM protein with 4Fe4S-binding SPASM domain